MLITDALKLTVRLLLEFCPPTVSVPHVILYVPESQVNAFAYSVEKLKPAVPVFILPVNVIELPVVEYVQNLLVPEPLYV